SCPASSCLSFTAPSPSLLYALSLHDALPISRDRGSCRGGSVCGAEETAGVGGVWVVGGIPMARTFKPPCCTGPDSLCAGFRVPRSEEHTSELQSLAYLVCRLLLEKKNFSLHS